MKPVKEIAKSHAVQTTVGMAAAAAAGAVAGSRRARRASSQEMEVPDLPVDDAPAIEGYCVKERKKVMIQSPEQTTMKNGKPAIRGVCPDCGTKIFRIGSLAA